MISFLFSIYSKKNKNNNLRLIHALLLVACSSSSADVHWRQSTRSHGGAACPRKRRCYRKPGQQPGTPRSLTRFQQGSRLRVALADTSCPVAAYTVCFHQVTSALWLPPAWDAVLWQRRFKFSSEKKKLMKANVLQEVICSGYLIMQEQPHCTSTITRRLTVQMAHITGSYLQPNLRFPKSRRDEKIWMRVFSRRSSTTSLKYLYKELLKCAACFLSDRRNQKQKLGFLLHILFIP